MTAYVIMQRTATKDPAEMAIYAPKAGAARGDHAITALAFYGRHEVKEGGPVEGVVVLSFPTFAQAEAWYHSPAYQEAAQHRFKGADYSVVIVEGVDA